MKLTKLHMLLILLFVLLASSWGWTVREYMKGGIDDEEEGEAVWEKRRGGGNFGPGGGFLPGVPTPKPKKARCIPAGDEDYYVLKSQVVPPVCPKCPDARTCPSNKKCPPCPAPKRCPEPAFECKKVPNYNAGGAGGAFGGDGGAGDALAGVGDGTGGQGGSSNSAGGRSAPQPRLNSFSQF